MSTPQALITGGMSGGRWLAFIDVFTAKIAKFSKKSTKTT
jgi:hypothetical protein